jgi:hypothetical protein
MTGAMALLMISVSCRNLEGGGEGGIPFIGLGGGGGHTRNGL